MSNTKREDNEWLWKANQAKIELTIAQHNEMLTKGVDEHSKNKKHAFDGGWGIQRDEQVQHMFTMNAHKCTTLEEGKNMR